MAPMLSCDAAWEWPVCTPTGFLFRSMSWLGGSDSRGMCSNVRRRWHSSSAAPPDDGVVNAFGRTEQHRMVTRRRKGSVNVYRSFSI